MGIGAWASAAKSYQTNYSVVVRAYSTNDLQAFLNVVRPISPALLWVATIPRDDVSFSLIPPEYLLDAY